MIFVEGWVRLAPGEGERFRPAAIAMMQASRQEPGCLEYTFSQDFADGEVVRVIERWTDEAALAAHFQTQHMAAFNKALAEAKRVDGSVKVYSGAFVRTLIGADS